GTVAPDVPTAVAPDVPSGAAPDAHPTAAPSPAGRARSSVGRTLSERAPTVAPTPVAAPASTARRDGQATPPPEAPAAPSSGVDALARLKDRAAAALFERMGARLNDPTLSEDQLHALVRSELNHVVEQGDVPLSSEQRRR